MSRFTPTAIFDDPTDTDTVTSPTPPTTTTTSTTSTTSTSTTSTSTTTSSTTDTTTSSTSTDTTTSTTDTTTSTTTTQQTTQQQTVINDPTQVTTTPLRTTANVPQNTRVFTSTLTSTSETATTTPSGSSGASAGSIVGIAAGVIIGIALLIAAIMFVLRRIRKRKDEEFDDEAFRRQSVMLPDDTPSPLYRGNSGGRGARPPTMIERHYAAYGRTTTPAPPGGAYGQGQPFGVPNGYNDYQQDRAPSPSFVPGQIVSQHPVQYANPSPFYNPPTQSPGASVPPYNSAYDEHGNYTRQPSPPMMMNANAPAPVEGDYANLSRASVTPFQQAQYNAISQQLNIAPPIPQPDAVGKLPSPFEDPGDDTTAPARPSSEFDPAHGVPVTALAMNEPPVPRVASVPPTIDLPQPGFSPVTVAFPGSAAPSPSPMRGNFNDGNAAMDPPLSPRAATPQRGQVVDVPSKGLHDGRETPVQIEFTGHSQGPAAAPMAAHGASTAKDGNGKKRPETMYDDEDAYGGI